MLKVAAGRVEGFHKASIQLEFNTQTLNTRGSVVYGNSVDVEWEFHVGKCIEEVWYT